MPFKKKNSPYWYITWTDGVQFTRSSKTTNFSEAKRLENEYRSRKKKPAGLRTVESVLTQYSKDKANDRTDYAILALLGEWDKYYISDITTSVIREYRTGVSSSTIKRELGVLRAAINHCNSLGWSLPEILKGNIPKEAKHRVRWITKRESIILRRVSPPHLRLFIDIALNTGMRKLEILNLTWDRVDLDLNLIHFSPDQHKSKTYATIPVNTRLKRRLTRLNSSLGHVVTYRGTNVRDIKRGFKTACIKSGILDFRPHDLRHTFASWLVQAEVPILTVKELMRHSDIQSTMIYAHLDPGSGREAVEIL